jgi:hypothetical protein
MALVQSIPAMLPAPQSSQGAMPPAPPESKKRYTDNDDGTVTDNNTGLIWLKNANAFGRQNWNIAQNYYHTFGPWTM